MNGSYAQLERRDNDETLLSDSQVRQVTASILSNWDASEWVRRQVMKSLNQVHANMKTEDEHASRLELTEMSMMSGDKSSFSFGDNNGWESRDDHHRSGDSLQRANEKIAILESQIHNMDREISALKQSSTQSANMNTRRRQLMFRNYAGIVGAKKTICNFDDDTFALMMITYPCSYAWALGLISFFFQITLGVMIAINQVNDGLGSSDFNIPFRVDPVVRVGQFLTIILCLSTQSDVLTSILSFILLDRKSNWREIVGVIDTSKNNWNSSWFVRIALPNAMKLIQGILVIFISFVIIVQSDDIIDLLKDFTALMILSETDNILFQLADLGFLGRSLQAEAVRVKEIEIEDSPENGVQLLSPRVPPTSTDSDNGILFDNEVIEIENISRRNLNTNGKNGRPSVCNSFPKIQRCYSMKRNRAFYVRSNGLLFLFTIMLGGWLRIICNQDGGKYFREIYPNCTSRDEDVDMFDLAKKHFGDSKCFGGDLNTLGCQFEGGDCVDFNLAYPLCKGKDMTNVQLKLENGICDDDMNIPECDFDGGQCCPSSIRHSLSFGDGQCNGGKISTEKCFYDNGDCKVFAKDFPYCPLDELSLVDGSSEIVLGNGICEGGMYTNELCGYEYGDCDQGQVGQDVTFRHVSSITEPLDFQMRLSADGSHITVGLHDTNENGSYNATSPGRVKIFGYDTGTKRWIKSSADLVGDTPDESFGFSTAMNLDGSKIVVGIPNHRSILGQVKVFHFDSSQKSWTQVGQEFRGISFTGHSVDITADGSRLAISSPQASTDKGWLTGIVQIFAFDMSRQTWAQIGTDVSGNETGDNIGYYHLQICSSGSRVFFSVGYESDPDRTAIRVYEYKSPSKEWFQVGIDIPNPYPRFFHRPAISADGNRIATSSYISDTSRQSQVQVFDLDMSNSDGIWQQVGVTILDEGRRADSGFGYNIDMNSEGTLLAIGTVNLACLGGSKWCSTGSIQLYRYNSNMPPRFIFSQVPLRRIGDFGNTFRDATNQDIRNTIFGWDVSLSGNGSTISIGSYDFERGEAFFKVYNVEDLFYPDCVVRDPGRIGNGICDDMEPYYTEQCFFDGGDCPLPSSLPIFPDCFVRDPMQLGDGTCSDYPPLYSEQCGYDGGDCHRWFDPPVVEGYPNCSVWNATLIGNGNCDDRPPYNGKECGFDGGDCL